MTRDDFTGKTVMVTGAAQGIGAAIARHFAGAGARLVLNDLKAAALTSLAAELEGAPTCCPGNIAELATVEALFKQAGALGGADVLVNNAGLTRTYKPFLETTLTDWDSIMAVNLRAAYLTSLYAARHWAQAGRPGCIINISSPGSVRSHLDNSIYDASKAGLDALTRSLAVDLRAYGIRANAVAPAAVRQARQGRPAIPIRLETTVDDVAEAVLFLASDAAAAINGHVLAVDGGLLAHLRPETSA